MPSEAGTGNLEADTRRLLINAWGSGADRDTPELLAATADALSSKWLTHCDGLGPLPYTAVAVARAAGAVARARGGGGTTLPGKVLLAQRPDAIARLGARLGGGVVLVGGTNGKTTTAALIAAIARCAGRSVIHNHAGANLHWGVATALAEQSGDIGVLEVDEAWLPLVAAQLKPRVVVLGNLFRDRLDGYGERDAIARTWDAMVRNLSGATTYVLNADDPTVAQLGRASATSVYFGIDDRAIGRSEREHAADARSCPDCGARLRFDRYFLSHLGHYACERCGTCRPVAQVAARDVCLQRLTRSSFRLATPAGAFDVRLRMGGMHSVYNALAATAAARTLGFDQEAIVRGLEEMRPVFGRAEVVRVGGADVTIMLMKNPAGANELVRMLRAQGSLHLWIALNDGSADGRDVSWIWDVDFEALAECVRHVTCSGTRAADLAMRLKYAGWPLRAMVVDEDLGSSLDAAMARAPTGVVALPTYSAMVGLRLMLTGRGLAPNYWD